MNLLSRARIRRSASLDAWQLADRELPLVWSATQSFGREDRPDGSYMAFASTLGRSSILWTCIGFRVRVFAEMRFLFRELRDGRGAGLFSGPELAMLRRPWSGGTTGDLLSRMMLDVELAGNSYEALRPNGLKRMRPDWVTIVAGSYEDPQMDGWDLDAELLGYIYEPPSGRAQFLLPNEVCHFAPVPDPLAFYRGVPWIVAALREVGADNAATDHKAAFFRNGATPNYAIVFDAALKAEQVKKFKDLIEAEHKGAANAYRTLYLGGGAKVVPVASALKDLDLHSVVGKLETRIANAAGLHPAVLGLSEGLQGSALNSGNYNAARRATADATMWPLWHNVAGSLANVVDVPDNAELWFDEAEVPFLRQDESDAAEILKQQVLTIESAIRAGYEPDSVTAAITSGDLTQLRHTGLYSVQLQPPGSNRGPAPADTSQEGSDG